MLRETMARNLRARITADTGYGARAVPSECRLGRITFLDGWRASRPAFRPQSRFGLLALADCSAGTCARAGPAAKLAWHARLTGCRAVPASAGRDGYWGLAATVECGIRGPAAANPRFVVLARGLNLISSSRQRGLMTPD